VNHIFDWANAVAFHAFGQTIKWADLLGNLLGLATVGFALRRSLWTWPVQIASAILLFGATSAAHLGGSAARQVALGGMAVYGWYRWSAVREERAEVKVRWASWAERGVLVGVFAAGTVAFAWLLTVTHSSWAPKPDAYIFIGSLVATAAQAKGYVEFWLVWIAVDVVGVPLNFQNGLPVSGMIYGVYGAIVVAGLWQWILKARAHHLPSSPAVELREKVAA
jgi:nicotinamide mononucleotide transporter